MFSKYYVPPAGSSADGDFTTVVTPESAGWTESSLWTLELAPGADVHLQSGDNEIIVVPLAGSAVVVAEGGRRFPLTGRASVFDGPSDFAYVGRDADYSVSSADGGGRFALCGARAGAKLPPSIRSRIRSCGRAPRCRELQPTGSQLRHRRHLRGRLHHRV